MGDPSSSENPAAETFSQYVASLTACLGGFSLGCCLGWSSPVSAILIDQKDFSEFHTNLIGSAVTVGAAFGTILVPFLIDSIGRKSTMLCLVPPFLGGWVLLASGGKSLPLFIVGRLITGACSGMFCVCAPMYTAEIAQPKIRGDWYSFYHPYILPMYSLPGENLVCDQMSTKVYFMQLRVNRALTGNRIVRKLGTMGVFFQLLLVIGILYVYSIGFVDSDPWISGLCTVGPIIFAFMMFCMPESPLFYMMKDREDLARNSMQFFRGEKYNVDTEISELKESIALSKSRKVNVSMLRSKPVVKMFGIAYGMMAAQQLSGINAVIFYSVIIFKAAGSKMHPLLQSVILASVQVVACIPAAILIDKMGRKFLMVISELLMGLCLLCLGAYSMVRSSDEKSTDDLAWLPLLITSIYIMAFCLGAGPIPWTYMGEIFPPELKGAASSSAAFINWLLAFAVTVPFSTMVGAIGAPGTFWIFSIICFVNVGFCYFCMIETKGKTLEVILRELGLSWTNAENDSNQIRK